MTLNRGSDSDVYQGISQHCFRLLDVFLRFDSRVIVSEKFILSSDLTIRIKSLNLESDRFIKNTIFSLF
ncbi:hypothetical protein D1872_216780 [compost metagenome]